MNKRLYVETWGCQMNRHQSEGIRGVLEAAGFTSVDRLEDADVAIFNTCMVRQKAEEKVYGRIGAVVEEKRTRPLLLGIGGCMPQVYGETLLDRFPIVDFLFGSTDLRALPDLLADLDERAVREAHLPTPAGIDELPAHRENGVTGMVTITQGCSNACSYCIVPAARGPLRSRSPEAILAEVEDLVRTGYPEVLLLGQNADSYGKDRPIYGDLANLLDRVAQTGIPRIRFTTSHPRDLTQRILDVIAARDTICKHLHLACQSGSDRILAEMHRGYTRDGFLTLAAAARRTIPEVNLTTDLIVGYPGESDADFDETLDLIEAVRFGSIFVAKYSPRPGTRSARLADDVPAEAKDERLHAVLELQRRIALEENEARIGATVLVLVEGRTRRGALYGRADDHRTVVFFGNAGIGDFVKVRIEAASAAALVGCPAATAATEVRG
jgi:tRNA-2-methylthio-N6-dimethylallyladenosine synthase